jgi:PhnB protein
MTQTQNQTQNTSDQEAVHAELPQNRIAPHLFVDDAAKAIEFYKKAFSATELGRHPAPDGKRLMHAALLINGSLVMLCDDFPEMCGGKSRTPKALGGSAVTIHMQVADVDAKWQQAVAAGAEIEVPLADQFWGDRYGTVRDPFGHSWSMGTAIKKKSN